MEIFQMREVYSSTRITEQKPPTDTGDAVQMVNLAWCLSQTHPLTPMQKLFALLAHDTYLPVTGPRPLSSVPDADFCWVKA